MVFSTNISLYFENDNYTKKDEQELVCDLANDVISSDLQGHDILNVKKTRKLCMIELYSYNGRPL